MSHPSARTLLDRYGLAAKKSWGQNFLADPSVPPLIAAACNLGPGDTVLEIGAGLGHLTAALLETGAHVVAVERDRDMAMVLRGELGANPRFELREQSVQDFDFAELAARTGRPYWAAGNLPYNLSSQILIRLLDERASLRGFVVMLQREVAERIAAPPGGREYGVLSVFLQAHTDVHRVMDVHPGAFLPAPKVTSTVLRFDVLPASRAPIPDEALFRKVVHAAFGQRRKTLRNSLSHGLSDLLGRAGATRGATTPTDTPPTDTPATDTPATDTPATDPPATDTPATDPPDADTPATPQAEAAPAERVSAAALAERVLVGAGIDPMARAETLGVEAFARLTQGFTELIAAHDSKNAGPL